MPELPEVEIVRRGLAEHVVGRRIVAASVAHARTIRRQPGGPDEFSALLTGRLLTSARRRGKFLWLPTDDPDVVLAAHLGMSGQFRVDGAPADRPGPSRSAAPGDVGLVAHPHARARWDLEDRTLWFLDQRTFGWVAALPVVADGYGQLVPAVVGDIALDPADPRFDAASVARRMHRHRVEVKRLLLDQSVVSGIGNIYADEALWLAGVHPRRRADRLPVRVLAEVLAAAAQVMAASLAEGGTSFDSLYVDVNGRSGYFERGLQVYGRAGLPCARCGTPILRERFTNRSSHFCPRCQPRPRTSH